MEINHKMVILLIFGSKSIFEKHFVKNIVWLDHDESSIFNCCGYYLSIYSHQTRYNHV